MISRYENMTLIPERRGSAIGIIDHMLAVLPTLGIDPFTRIFNWVVNDPFEHQALYEEAKMHLLRRSSDIYVRAKKYFGFATSGAGETARSHLYGAVLRIATRRCAHLVKSRRLVEQITSLENRNGRIDHPKGGHDDLVIAFLLTHWFLNTAKNMQHYGIDSRTVMIAHQAVAKQEINTWSDYEQLEIRNQISILMQKLDEEIEPSIVHTYEQQLRALDRRLILKDGEHFSLDAVLNQVKEERNRRRSQQSSQYLGNAQEYLGYHYANQTNGEFSSSPMGNFYH